MKEYECPGCGHRVSDPTLWGLEVVCPKCKVAMIVRSEEMRLQAARQRLLAVTDEEWNRIRDEEGEFTLEEIIRELEKS